MAIAKGYKANFETLTRAFKSGHVALLEVQEKSTGKTRVAIVATQPEDNGDTTFVPFALMFDGNPYDELNPPNPDGGYHVD